ncbi:MAG: substrate-binding domain-containing protein, partial [Alphaproteobacteria bacterium]
MALAATAAIAGSFAVVGPAAARDEVKIAGSSTVLPYAKIVAEQFQKANPKFKVIVESGGSSAGIKLFCKGVGPEFIDVADASRPIKKKEIEACAKAGVKDIVQVQFGYDGIVFASAVNGPEIKLEPKDMFLALAPKIVKDGKIVANPNKTWKQVNAAFPEWDIVAFIPGEKHGTREVFEKKMMAAGCKETGALKLYEAEAKAAGKDDKKAHKAAKKACMRVRKDDGGSHAIDIDGDYTETLARLDA